MKRPHIVVIGAVAVDVKVHSFGTLVRHSDVPGRVQVTLGGVARNIAKNLALLGTDATILSVIGDDEFGRMIHDDLARAGVNVDNLMIAREQYTAAWVGILDPRGDLDVGVFGGTIFDTLTPDAVREHAAMIVNADLIAVDATLPRVTIDEIVTMAKASQVPLYLNPASVARAQIIANGVGNFALVTANALETEVLTGQTIRVVDDARCAAHTLIEQGVQRAIITLGANGIVYADTRETRYAPAPPTRVVDTTGAGDALAAMFLLSHLQARGLDETLERVLRAAAITAACEESVNEDIAACE